MPRAYAQVMVVLAAGCLTACGKHNDVLLFGTDTTVAVDISASPTQGNTPQLSIGYKRREAVWMPLLANADDSEAIKKTCSKTQGGGTQRKGTRCSAENGQLADAKYVGEDSNHRTDAYSVFASFGAEIEGSVGGGGDAKAKVGLAQFFATGVAAQKLADNPAAVFALSIQPPGTSEAIGEALNSAELRKEREFRASFSQRQMTTANLLATCPNQQEKFNDLRGQKFSEGFFVRLNQDRDYESIFKALTLVDIDYPLIEVWTKENCKPT